MAQFRVYLAGPEVFLRNAKAIGGQKKKLCRKYGFKGIFPLDAEADVEGKCPRDVGLCISEANEGLIRSCEIMIANITPFRGPSADIGTAFEMGFAHGLGKKVFAYTNVATDFTDRTLRALDGKVKRSLDGKLRDTQGMFVEEVGLTDNLMIDGCINANTKFLVSEEAPPDERFTYLVGFEKCLAAAKKIINNH